MVEQLCAYGLLCWMFPLGPLLCLWIGIQIGRLGWRPALTMMLVKIFGALPESEGIEVSNGN